MDGIKYSIDDKGNILPGFTRYARFSAIPNKLKRYLQSLVP
ncbi:hypothetical protein QWZ13_18515 [Reinekea marina]|nr:hypothetical protein [Reinekea marina]MDN3650906.1 hypothetical protein [Reinekea marina]